MSHRLIGSAIRGLTAVGAGTGLLLVTLAAPSALAAPTLSGHPATATPSAVRVAEGFGRHGLGVFEAASGAVSLSRHHLRAGVETIGMFTEFSTPNGTQLQVFRMRHHGTLTGFSRRLDVLNSDNASPAASARAIRWVARHVTAYGGDWNGVTGFAGAMLYQAVLRHGHYYVADLTNNHDPAAVADLWVSGRTRDTLPWTGQSIDMVTRSHDRLRFAVNGHHGRIHNGWLGVANYTDELHFLTTQPVKWGTTNAQITAFANNPTSGPPAFARNGRSITVGVVSPGVSLRVLVTGLRGEYDAECYVPDDMTGMPHFFMGMHQVFWVRAHH